MRPQTWHQPKNIRNTILSALRGKLHSFFSLSDAVSHFSLSTDLRHFRRNNSAQSPYMAIIHWSRRLIDGNWVRPAVIAAGQIDCNMNTVANQHVPISGIRWIEIVKNLPFDARCGRRCCCRCCRCIRFGWTNWAALLQCDARAQYVVHKNFESVDDECVGQTNSLSHSGNCRKKYEMSTSNALTSHTNTKRSAAVNTLSFKRWWPNVNKRKKNCVKFTFRLWHGENGQTLPAAVSWFRWWLSNTHRPTHTQMLLMAVYVIFFFVFFLKKLFNCLAIAESLFHPLFRYNANSIFSL